MLDTKYKTFLDRWQGGDVQVCGITTSHSILTLRITDLHKSGNLEIACIRPTEVILPDILKWTDAHIEILYDKSTFTVIDNKHFIKIICDYVEVAENIKDGIKKMDKADFYRVLLDKNIRFEKCNEYEECAVRKFFEEQEKLPLSMRSNVAMISCRCKRCNPYTL